MDLKAFQSKFEHKPVVENFNSVPAKPMLSICVQTYQHVGFIEACLESILQQKTNFEFEILLGEDASTDGTREICIKYAEKFPDKIRLFLHHRENNIEIGGAPTGRFNFMYNLFSARGKYIALCEGDDYWTDPLKLQKQVDFLEDNPDYNICFHRVNILDKGKLFPDYIEGRYNNIKNRPISIIDLLREGNFIHTTSVVFRNKIVEFPFEFYMSSVGDYFLHIMNSQDGYIHRLDDIMAVYRKGVGIFSSLSNLHMKFKILNYQSCLLSYLKLDEHKEILLEKNLKTLDSFSKSCEKTYTNNHYLSKKLSFKSILKIVLLKLKF